MEPWWKIFLRHASSAVIIVGAMWWLATPRVEAFIIQTVESRFARIESQLDLLIRQQQEIIRQLDALDKDR